MGGAAGATRTMGPSARTATGVGQVISDFVGLGAAEALRPFNLESLAGAPASDVFIALTDVLCPDGGTIDEAIARGALLETAAELAAGGDVPFDALTTGALEAVFLGTITRSIEIKLFNELGSGAVVLTTDAAAVQAIQTTVHDYIAGSVSDAFATNGQTPTSMPRGDVERLVTTIYEGAFSLLEAFGEGP